MREKRNLYFRRCHVCHHTTQKLDPILYCEECHKSVAPALFYSEHEVPTWSEDGVRPALCSNDKVYKWPLMGITALWPMGE